jgi:hypothetical protein
MTKTSDESENKAVLVRLTPAMTREQKLKNLVGALEKQGIKIKRSPGAETVKNGDASFFIANDRLYTDRNGEGRREVTHVRRTDGGGEAYLKLWISDGNVLGGYSTDDPMFTLTIAPDGSLTGQVPGGYQYDFVIADI